MQHNLFEKVTKRTRETPGSPFTNMKPVLDFLSEVIELYVVSMVKQASPNSLPTVETDVNSLQFQYVQMPPPEHTHVNTPQRGNTGKSVFAVKFLQTR